MNFRSLVLSVMLTAGVLSGCNDDITYVGGSIQPDGDKINVSVDSFMMTATTVRIDSLYSKSSYGYLGEFHDPLYGSYKGDFISQFYCPENFKFDIEPLDGKIDSVDFWLYLDQTMFLGDTLSPMVASVYPVTKPLDRNYYTNIKPEDYCDTKTLLGSKAYSLYDASLSRKSDTIIVRLPRELGQRIYDETVNNPSSFVNQEAFNRFFPGLYVTNSYGMGAVAGVYATTLRIYHSYRDTLTAKDGSDSVVIAKTFEPLIVTNEVVQMNRMSSMGFEELLKPNDKYTYIKSPAGVYTQLTIPAKEILNKIGDRIINDLPITVKAMPQEDWVYAGPPPTDMLLLPKDSLNAFFEKNKMHDQVTSFLASVSSLTYKFSNIARLLKAHKENSPDKDLELLLVPVRLVTSRTNTGTINIDAIRNYMIPSGLTLRKEADLLNIKVTTSVMSI